MLGYSGSLLLYFDCVLGLFCVSMFLSQGTIGWSEIVAIIMLGYSGGWLLYFDCILGLFCLAVCLCS